MNLPKKDEYLVGVVSDTHGLLRPEAVDILRGADLILHAGDIGGPQVLSALEALAPVVAVRGNVDTDAWSMRLPVTEMVELGAVTLYLLHDFARLDLDPVAAGVQAIVSGHSHQPAMRQSNGVLYLNPGSIGPRRFRLPISLALLRIRGQSLEPRFFQL
ncbi:MAG: metallophosphoesterase family protein [Desulfuromonadales bacterium]|jgi:putative phosphoesterase